MTDHTKSPGHDHTGHDHADHDHEAHAHTSGAMASDRVAIPVKEEKLNVEKQETELGEVRLHKTVTEEEQRVPVDLRREEVRVERQEVAERPLRAGEEAFTDTTIRVPIRGEEAVVNKEAVVTGEVVVSKEATTERREVSETLRKEQVDIDESYHAHRPEFEQHWQQRQSSFAGGAQSGRTWADAEPNYQYGYSAANDPSYQGRDFDDAETDLRDKWGTSPGTSRGVGTSGGPRTGDGWEQLREEIREGWNRARGR